MKFRTLLLSLSLTAVPVADAASPAPTPLIDQQFEQTVRPFVGKYCVACHSGKMAPAQFDLKSYTNVDMVADDFDADRDLTIEEDEGRIVSLTWGGRASGKPSPALRRGLLTGRCGVE